MTFNQSLFICCRNFIISAAILFTPKMLFAQAQPLKDSGNFVRMQASDNYYKSSSYQKKWGDHYRKEWHTPVLFKKAMLDTLAGGVKPYQAGGGRQSKSLRLHDKNNREYVLRSVDKTFDGALPEVLQNTVWSDIANDQITFSHPYAALVVADLAESAGIFHTNPIYVYVPKQTALGDFSEEYGNRLYLFEQRPDEDWSTAKNFGNSKKIQGTSKMLDKILEDNDNLLDQKLFLKSRLFDMLIGDWGRHEDQWRWAKQDKGDQNLYQPIPRDRDNAFTKMDGRYVKMGLSLAGGSHMENFDYSIKDVNRFNFTARNLDRRILNELSYDDWIAVTKDLQARMTNAAIENAVRKMPPEVFPISGPEIIAKLKSRAQSLPMYAQEYYNFIAKNVDIPGTEKHEKFVVERLPENETSVSVFKINKKGDVENEPIYQRIFKGNETNEIRLYGIDNTDQFEVKGKEKSTIKLRLVGGKENDNYKIEGSGKNIIYDNKSQKIDERGNVKLKLRNDSTVHDYIYEGFNFDKKGFLPFVFYSNDDRIYVGFQYKMIKQQWRKTPFGQSHKITARYSFAQKLPSIDYEGIFKQTFGKWDFRIDGNLDLMRWTNFFGMGNENKIPDTSLRDYTRYRSRVGELFLGIEQNFNNIQRFKIGPYIEFADVLNDTGRLFKTYFNPSTNPDIYDAKQFAGLKAEYVFQKLNDSIMPISGISFIAGAKYGMNLKESSRTLGNFTGEIIGYVPFSKKFGIKLSAGGATLVGDPEIYQYNKIGRSKNLRGIQRDRYWGEQSFYSMNEIRFITDWKNRIIPGKFGIFGLYDLGRTWLKGQNSNTIHHSIGGGFMFAPFNKLTVQVSYATSKDDSKLNLSLYKPF